MNITNQSSTAWLNISVYYIDSDWQDAGINGEGSLGFQRYSGGAWQNVTSSVDTVNNIVRANGYS